MYATPWITWWILYSSYIVTRCYVCQDEIWSNIPQVICSHLCTPVTVHDYFITGEDKSDSRRSLPAWRFPLAVIWISLRSLIKPSIFIFRVSERWQCWVRWGMFCISERWPCFTTRRNRTGLLAECSYVVSYVCTLAMCLFNLYNCFKHVHRC